MKYTILGFNQEKLIEYGMDVVDALILRYIVDFYGTGKMSTVQDNGKTYFWLKYSTLIEEIPITKINSKDVLRRRLKKMSESGILEHYTNKKKGTFSCYRLVDTKYSALVSKNARGTTIESEGYDQAVAGGATEKSEQKISPLEDQSTKISESQDSEDPKSSKTKPSEPSEPPPKSSPAPEKFSAAEYAEIYEREVQGVFSYDKSSKVLKKLQEMHGREKTLAGWEAHCKDLTIRKYTSAHYFAKYPLQWIPKAPVADACTVPEGHMWT